MDVFDLEWASEPQVSSDGETIAYVFFIMNDRVRSNLWRISNDGSNHRPFIQDLKIHILHAGLQIMKELPLFQITLAQSKFICSG